jgi:hypothetical protein
MPACIYSRKCFFFKEGYLRSPTGNFLREDFCYRGPSFCAIYMVFGALGTDSIPPDLLPHETDKIRRFLR